jgi:glycosyltransferase involved in cell wall biosynthesis
MTGLPEPSSPASGCDPDVRGRRNARRNPTSREMSLRILFCTLGYDTLAAGGAERQARLQAEELVRRGHSVTVVAPLLEGARSETINGVDIRRLPMIDRPIIRNVTYLPLLAMFLMVRIRRFDVIHVHVANLQADVAAIAARLLRRPLYVKVATGGPLGEVHRFRRVSRFTRYVGLRSAARVQAISDEIESDLLSIGVPRARVLRIPNGIGLTACAGVRAGADPDERARLQLPDGAVVVLFVGRFAAYKGVEDLLAAWAQLREGRSKRLVLVGQRHDAPDHARSHGADVVVRPWTADIGAYLRAADIFVLPSHSEGMSNALLEAMACGLPSIATRVGAAETMIEHGHNGVLVEPGDPDKLARALDRLIEDPDSRRRMGLAAAASVRSRFDIRGVVDRIEAAHFEMAGSARGRPR